MYLFERKPGENTDEAIKLIFSEEANEINPGLPDVQKERRKQYLASKLIEKNANLEVFQFGYQEIASLESITEEEARIKYRHLELNGREDGNGIQITLFDDSVTITVPYWHKREKAKAVFEEIWEYMKIIQEETNYLIYDPQLEMTLNLSSGFSAALRLYKTTARWSEEAIISSQGEEKKPWWRFW